MSLWGATDAEISVPKYLSDEQRKHAIFIDTTEAANVNSRAKGIRGAGWYLFKEYKDSSGTIRNKAECLISMHKTVGQAGDRINDLGINQPESYVITIVTNPANHTVTHPAATTFTVASTISAGGGALSYQWQLAAPGSKVFSSISNAGVYSTATTNTLNISASTGLTGTKYRCIVSATNAVAEVSTYATLTVL